VLDNECYGETGQQRTHTALGTDLEAVARACGIRHTHTVRQADELAPLRDDLHTCDDVVFAVVKIAPEELPRVLPPRDGPYLTQRLRAALLGVEHALEA
jgi:thiamine pyrophosphate-dependent acetolactate synthase large subunit-like protein